MNRTNAWRGMVAVLVAAIGLLHGATASAEVVASEGWARATVPGATTGAAYIVLTNKGSEDAKLLVITSSLCDKIMIHRSTIDSQGIARMWPVGKLEIAPGESVRFDPNGLHIMFMDLKAPFVAGQKVPLKLIFEGEQPMMLMLEVRPLVATGAADHTPHQ